MQEIDRIQQEMAKLKKELAEMICERDSIVMQLKISKERAKTDGVTDEYLEWKSRAEHSKFRIGHGINRRAQRISICKEQLKPLLAARQEELVQRAQEAKDLREKQKASFDQLFVKHAKKILESNVFAKIAALSEADLNPS